MLIFLFYLDLKHVQNHKVRDKLKYYQDYLSSKKTCDDPYPYLRIDKTANNRTFERLARSLVVSDLRSETKASRFESDCCLYVYAAFIKVPYRCCWSNFQKALLGQCSKTDTCISQAIWNEFLICMKKLYSLQSYEKLKLSSLDLYLRL